RNGKNLLGVEGSRSSSVSAGLRAAGSAILPRLFFVGGADGGVSAAGSGSGVAACSCGVSSSVMAFILIGLSSRATRGAFSFLAALPLPPLRLLRRLLCHLPRSASACRRSICRRRGEGVAVHPERRGEGEDGWPRRVIDTLLDVAYPTELQPRRVGELLLR